MKRKPKIIKIGDGKWEFKGHVSGSPIYADYYIKYMNMLEEIFEKSRKESEFNFAFNLLNMRRLQSIKWGSFDTLNTVQIIFGKINDTFGAWRGASTHIGLFRYGLIIESDDIYSLIHNMVTGIGGDQGKMVPFAPEKKRDKKGKFKTFHIYAKEKIKIIKDLAAKNSIDVSFFDEIYDGKLRNSVFHSKYNFDAHKGELTLIGDGAVIENGKFEEVKDPDTAYSHDELLHKLNSAIAFYDVLMDTVLRYKKSFVAGESIAGTHTLTGLTFKAIVKDGHGLVGLVEINPFTDKPDSSCVRVGELTIEDAKLVDSGTYSLSRSKNETLQRIIDSAPRKIQPLIGRTINKIYKSK